MKKCPVSGGIGPFQKKKAGIPLPVPQGVRNGRESRLLKGRRDGGVMEDPQGGDTCGSPWGDTIVNGPSMYPPLCLSRADHLPRSG